MTERIDHRSSLTVPARRSGRVDTVVGFVLGVALVYGALDQGGFYPEQFGTMLGLVVAALVLAVVGARMRRPPAYLVGCAAAWLAFTGWVLLEASRAGPLAIGLPAAAVAGCLAAAAWSAGVLAEPGRQLLGAVVLAVGVVVAAPGWVGVAWHRAPLALPSSGLWRAASTLTYANATAALLVIAILAALAALPGSRRLLSGPVLAVLLLGLTATMSRAGALALVVGLAVAAGAPDLRRRMARHWPVLPATAVGFAGLLPSLPETSAPHPWPALAGLLGAATVLLLADRRPRSTAAATTVGLALALPLIPPRTLAAIGDTRLTAASPERADLLRVALAQFGTAPVAGVGPGRLDLGYLDHAGVPVLARFVHQEYLQVAAETGVIGLALVLAGVGALAAGALAARAVGRCGRSAAPGPSAALAVLSAFAVHSAFDFLWHIPVLPLLAVLAAVALVPVPRHTLEQEIP